MRCRTGERGTNGNKWYAGIGAIDPAERSPTRSIRTQRTHGPVLLAVVNGYIFPKVVIHSNFITFCINVVFVQMLLLWRGQMALLLLKSLYLLHVLI